MIKGGVLHPPPKQRKRKEQEKENTTSKNWTTKPPLPANERKGILANEVGL